MKRLLLMIVALIGLVGGSVSQAEQSLRIWEKAGGENFAVFFAKLKAAGYAVTETGIKAEHLGLAACLGAGNYLDLLDPQYRPPEVCAKKFLEFAFVSKPEDNIPEWITWKYFKRKALGEVGWHFPVDNDNQRRLQMLENQVVTLQLKVEDLAERGALLEEIVAELQSQQSTLEGELEALQHDTAYAIARGESAHELIEQNKMIAQSALSLAEQAGKEAATAIATVGDMDGKFNEAKNTADEAKDLAQVARKRSDIFTVVAVLALLLGVIMLVVDRRRSRRAKAQAKQTTDESAIGEVSSGVRSLQKTAA